MRVEDCRVCDLIRSFRVLWNLPLDLALCGLYSINFILNLHFLTRTILMNHNYEM